MISKDVEAERFPSRGIDQSNTLEVQYPDQRRGDTDLKALLGNFVKRAPVKVRSLGECCSARC